MGKVKENDILSCCIWASQEKGHFCKYIAIQDDMEVIHGSIWVWCVIFCLYWVCIAGFWKVKKYPKYVIPPILLFVVHMMRHFV